MKDRALRGASALQCRLHGDPVLVIGREPASEGGQFHEQIGASAVAFSGPFAIAIARGTDSLETRRPRPSILSRSRGPPRPVVARNSPLPWRRPPRGSVTALHFVARSQGPAAARSRQREVGAAIAPMASSDAVMREIVSLGDPLVMAAVVLAAWSSMLCSVRSSGGTPLLTYWGRSCSRVARYPVA